MHDDDQRFRPPTQPAERKGAKGALGGIVVALGLAAAKFKTLLFGGLALWKILLGAKFLLSFGSIFLSLWLYAVLFGGWKIAIVFVLLILVHEMGHFVTWRNFGVKASLPTFIPGFGAFVSAPPTGTPAQNAAAALAGPVFGVAAAAICWGFGIFLGDTGGAAANDGRFWLGCAYIGFFLNLFNLIPIPPFDGGAVAGAVDARLWLVGIALLALFVIFFARSGFTFLILFFVALTAIPRVLQLVRGEIDPRGSGLSDGQRVATLIAYVVLVGVALAGMVATNIAERA